MGGKAFKWLNCPRISPEEYHELKEKTTATLRTIFANVTVPTEMPEKPDYGDIDFLVQGPLHSPCSTDIETFDWKGTVDRVKPALNTQYGRRGYNNPDTMFFAVPSSKKVPSSNDEGSGVQEVPTPKTEATSSQEALTPKEEAAYWIQVDLKVCFKKELFEWETFRLNYASSSKILGSILKPLGLVIDPEGIHIRVKGLEGENLADSMIWFSRDPKDVLRIMKLDRRILEEKVFATKEELYHYFAQNWLFNAAHFGSRIQEERYLERYEDRSAPWVHYLTEWIPSHYPEAKAKEEGVRDLQIWYKQSRSILREDVFTQFPHIAQKYYHKNHIYLREVSEKKLRQTISAAIPIVGWKDNISEPPIIRKSISSMKKPAVVFIPSAVEVPTPMTSLAKPPKEDLGVDTPLHLELLYRQPPSKCIARPPPAQMSVEAKLLCLARWTLFDADTGKPFLLSAPRDKDFEMAWADALYAGATEDILVKWAKQMWWPIWIRQSHVNHVGRWKRKFEKEVEKAEMEAQKAEMEAQKAEKEADKVQKANLAGALGSETNEALQAEGNDAVEKMDTSKPFNKVSYDKNETNAAAKQSKTAQVGDVQKKEEPKSSDEVTSKGNEVAPAKSERIHVGSMLPIRLCSRP